MTNSGTFIKEFKLCCMKLTEIKCVGCLSKIITKLWGSWFVQKENDHVLSEHFNKETTEEHQYRRKLLNHQINYQQLQHQTCREQRNKGLNKYIHWKCKPIISQVN